MPEPAAAPPSRTAAAGLEVAESHDLATLEELAPAWSELCDRCPWTTPFQRPEWLLPWARAFPPWEPRILTVWQGGRRGGRLAGLLPLFRYHQDGERRLALLGAGLSDYLDLVAEPGRSAAAAGALLGRLAATAGREWDLLDLEQLRPESPLLACPCPPGLAEELRPGDPCPGLDLSGGLAAAVPPRMRSNLRQFRRRAERLGAGEIALAEAGPGDWEEVLDALVAMHRARWAERGVPGVLDDPRTVAFHREVAPGFLARGALVLQALCIGGRTAAVFYGFQEGSTLFFYLQGFDAAWARSSPGVLLLGAVLEQAAGRGTAWTDFLRGQEEYKYRWGARDRPTLRRRLIPGRPAGPGTELSQDGRGPASGNGFAIP